MTRTWRRGPVLALVLAGVASGDLLIETSGTETLGTLRGLDAREVVFETEAGERRTLPRDGVARVELHRDLSGTDATRPGEVGDPLLEEVLGYVAGPEDYPSAGAVNLYLGETVRFPAGGGRERQVRNVVRVLRERGKDEGTVPARWFRDLGSYALLRGRTWVPGPGGELSLRGLTDKGVRVAPLYGSRPEYDRKMQALHTLPAVEVGAVVDWAYRVERSGEDPGLPPDYAQVLHLDEPVLQGRLEVRIHEDRDLVVHLTRTEGVTRRRFRDGAERVEVFEYRGREPPKQERRKPPPAEIHPAVFVAPRQSWSEARAFAVIGTQCCWTAVEGENRNVWVRSRSAVGFPMQGVH